MKLGEKRCITPNCRGIVHTKGLCTPCYNNAFAKKKRVKAKIARDAQAQK